MQRRGHQKAPDQQACLPLAGAGRAQQAGHGNTTGKAQTVELDHLLAQRNDHHDAQKGARKGREKGRQGIEAGQFRIGGADDENGRQREGDPGRGIVHPGSNRLVEVVLDDGATPQHAAQHGKAENGRNRRCGHGETELQADVDESRGHQHADGNAERHRRKGQFAVGFVVPAR